MPLFLEHGGNSNYLEEMADLLEGIHQGHEQNENFVEIMQQLGLIESVTLNITLNDQSQNQLSGFYMLDDEKLQSLDASSLEELSRRGLLLPAYMMVASQSQLWRLIDLRNARLVQ